MRNDPSALSISNRLRFLLRDSTVYGGGAVLSKAFGLLTFPLLGRYFSVEDYGTIDVFTALAALLSIALMLGQDTAVARFFYEYPEADRRAQLISQSLVLQVGALAVAMPLLWLAADPIIASLSQNSDTRVILQLVLLQIPCRVVGQICESLLKWTFCKWQFLAVSVGYVAATAVLLAAGMLWFELTVTAVFGIYAATNIVFGLLALWLCRRWLVRPEGFGYLRPVVAFAIPYALIASAAAFVPLGQRLAVAGLLGSRELGLFAAGAKVAALILLPIQAFQLAWGPFSLAIFRQPDAAATYSVVLKLFAMGIALAVLVTTFCGEALVVFLASERYAGAGAVVLPLALGLAVQATGWITGIGVGLSKKSYLSLYAYVVFLSTSAAGILLLGGMFGLVGVGWGACLGYCSKALAEGWLAQRAYPLSWPYRRVLGILIITLCLGLLQQAVSSHLGIVWGTAILLLNVGVLSCAAWVLLLSGDERDRARGLIETRVYGVAPRP